MNIRQLEAFRATVRVGTVNGAAELLGLSQPSVSRLIAELERSLALTLFDRINGRLVPTPEGQIIHEQVEHTFSAYDRIRELAADMRHTRIGNLSIACMPALGIGFLPAVIKAFCNAHPAVHVSLDIQASVKIEDWIAAQRIDFGLAELPFQREDIAVDEFCRVPYYAVMTPAHPLAAKSTLAPEDFSEQPFISMTPACQARHQVDQYFAERAIRRDCRLETSYLPAVCEMAAHGLGLGLADPFSVHDHLPRIAARALQAPIDFRVGLLYPKHRPMSRLGRSFIAFMKRCRDRRLKDVAALACPGAPRSQPPCPSGDFSFSLS